MSSVDTDRLQRTNRVALALIEAGHVALALQLLRSVRDELRRLAGEHVA